MLKQLRSLQGIHDYALNIEVKNSRNFFFVCIRTEVKKLVYYTFNMGACFKLSNNTDRLNCVTKIDDW
jgi:hypothetical protein